MSDALLAVKDLAITFNPPGGTPVAAMRGLSFSLHKGETLVLVGESGSGKSASALAIPRLLPKGTDVSGSIRFLGQELTQASEADLRALRGNRIGMIFQEPMTALNPLHRVGDQIAETLRLHRGLSQTEARARVLALMAEVGIDRAEERLSAFPHQLSGGQRQRVMIAAALACDPALLIADEPTTALDVTLQAQTLALLKRIQAERGLGILFITHDFGVVRRMADTLAVLRRGECVEIGPAAQVLTQPQAAYTRELLAAEPSGRPAPVSDTAPIVLEGRDLSIRFGVRRWWGGQAAGHIAVDNVSLSLRAGETLGIVGESGSGKSTLGLRLLRLLRGGGQVTLLGQDLDALPRPALRAARRQLQVVFQDPFGSLSPRLSVGEIIGEGLTVHRDGRDPAAAIAEALADVGLDPAMADRYPHEFSGGQRQRIALARALILRPQVLILDEPTSALDRSLQGQLIDLLRKLQATRGLAYLFISHDLAVVRALSHRLIVLKDGKIVETGATETVLTQPQNLYTQALLAAADLK
ncbi:microcin ABC transporter ATP-binding protein [Elstera litoralis]|uniref:Microcin ABC transporter ATP-binding protein n=1 Tax=Elstera litoralis TaxID=552518 RepID=A0A0F3IVT7_9PROT|nr:dipeptide ABC transporter ATP-binding protein [Elstera litoralis]KJV10811.1 microcin ABC transporter ATP-binding protein [Elstera litoralis]